MKFARIFAVSLLFAFALSCKSRENNETTTKDITIQVSESVRLRFWREGNNVYRGFCSAKAEPSRRTCSKGLLFVDYSTLEKEVTKIVKERAEAFSKQSQDLKASYSVAKSNLAALKSMRDPFADQEMQKQIKQTELNLEWQKKTVELVANGKYLESQLALAKTLLEKLSKNEKLTINEEAQQYSMPEFETASMFEILTTSMVTLLSSQTLAEISNEFPLQYYTTFGNLSFQIKQDFDRTGIVYKKYFQNGEATETPVVGKLACSYVTDLVPKSGMTLYSNEYHLARPLFEDTSSSFGTLVATFSTRWGETDDQASVTLMCGKVLTREVGIYSIGSGADENAFFTYDDLKTAFGRYMSDYKYAHR